MVHKFMHHIDFEEEEIIEVPTNSEDAIEFINNVINETMTNENTRKYLRKSDTTEVISSINKLIHYENLEEDSQSGEVAVAVSINSIVYRISERLMQAEIEAQAGIEATGRSLRKGSLIQSLVKENDRYRYVLIKVDHSMYLDTINLYKRIGLPLEEKILKSCVIDYDNNHNIVNISLYDSTKKMAYYWWSGLLELEPANKDDINTKKALFKISSTINNVVGKTSPPDATILRNRLKGYFNSNSQFDLNEFMKKVIDDYPIKVNENNEASFDKVVLKNKIKALSTKHFDNQFNIDINVINKNKSDTYKIDDRISLTLHDEVENLTDKIVVNDENEKYTLKLLDIPKDVYDKFNY